MHPFMSDNLTTNHELSFTRNLETDIKQTITDHFQRTASKKEKTEIPSIFSKRKDVQVILCAVPIRRCSDGQAVQVRKEA